jgi:hypothetical protein
MADEPEDRDRPSSEEILRDAKESLRNKRAKEPSQSDEDRITLTQAAELAGVHQNTVRG